MVKKLFTLMLMLLAIVSTADARIFMGEQLGPDDLKVGDKVLLRNPLTDIGRHPYGDYNSSYNGNEAPGQFQFLNFNTTREALFMNVPVLDEGFTDYFVFELEDADSPDPVSGATRFFLKNVATGGYFTGNTTTLSENKEDALPLVSITGEGTCSIWTGNSFFNPNTQINDKTLMLVNRTAENERGNQFAPFWNYGTLYYGSAGDISIWNVYEAVETESKLADLFLLRATYGWAQYFYEQYNYSDVDLYSFNEEAVGDFRLAYEDANYVWENQDEASAAAAYDKLKAAHEAAFPNGYGSANIPEGYYHFVSAYSGYQTTQGVEKAMRAAGNGTLLWGDEDANDALELFYVKPLEGGGYSIQSAATKLYLDKGDTEQMLMTEEQTTVQRFQLILPGRAQFYIYNADDRVAYFTSGHDNGAGVSGKIVYNTAGIGSGSAWYLRPMTDQALIDKLINESDQQIRDSKIEAALIEYEALRRNIVEDTRLVTDPKQFDSNSCQGSSEGTFAGLIDGNTHYNNGYHSQYNADFMGSALTTAETWAEWGAQYMEQNGAVRPDARFVGTGYHNLQVTFKEPVDKFYFSFVGRTGGTAYVDMPSDLEVYVTNDDELGASTDQADIDKWTFVKELTDEDGMPTSNIGGFVYTSPTFELDEPYKYVRFVVKNTVIANNPNYARAFAVPDVTGITWNVGEWNIYTPEIDPNSEYKRVAGMQEAIDAIDALTPGAREKLANNNATDADVDEYVAALNAVKALYIDRDVLDADLAEAVSEASSVFNKVTGERKNLLTDASQLSTNSSSAGDSSTLEHLLDDELHYNNNFHSYWNGDLMEAESTTAAAWQAAVENWVAGNSNNIGVGIGYHDLQVAFNEPVNNFYFQFTSRGGGTAWVDTPTDIGIYATNDPEVAATADMANIDQWTEIVRLNEENGEELGYEMPKYNTNSEVWFSPTVNLGDTYNYVRFVFYNTTRANGGRKYAHPEITGLTWNAQCFRVYQGVDPEHTQYNYDPEFRAEADALKALIDEANALPAHSILDNSLAEKIRAQVEVVNASKVDTTELHHLSALYLGMAENAVSGDGVGLVDTDAAIEAFLNGINDTKATVSPNQPTTSSVEAAVENLNKLYDEFITHVQFPLSNHWYNILSLSSREQFTNTPIYLGDTSSDTDASKLYIGNAEMRDNAFVDPYSTWRLLPVEDQIGVYYIQNYGTGQYMGKFTGDPAGDGTEAARPLLTHEPEAYQLVFAGSEDGAFKLLPTSAPEGPWAARPGNINALKTDGSGEICTFPWNSDRQQEFYFDDAEVPSEGVQYISWFPTATIQAITLPFETKGENTLEELANTLGGKNVKTYAIQYLKEVEDGENELGLKSKTEFEAGEPIIIVVGDPEAAYNGDPTPLWVPLAADVVDTAIPGANGLYGTLQGETIAAGLGIFVESKSVLTTADTFIAGRGAWINPKDVTNEDGTADLVIGTEVTGIKQLVKAIANGENVNVYTIDGKLVKKNVKATDAKKNLGKGIYIIGREKVAVK